MVNTCLKPFCTKKKKEGTSFDLGYEPKPRHLAGFLDLFLAFAMSDEGVSEKTPDSGGGIRAIEDVAPSAGVVACPAGPPVVLGPANWNPLLVRGFKGGSDPSSDSSG